MHASFVCVCVVHGGYFLMRIHVNRKMSMSLMCYQRSIIGDFMQTDVMLYVSI
mgnify:CR=1 FL=1